MGINLGFESLGIRSDRSGDLSYEYLDSLIQFNNAATEVLDLCHELSGVVRTYSQLDAITKTIKKYGVTQSLEALYGENFSGAASMEAEAEEAKKGLGQKIKEIIRFLKKKIVRFFQWMFSQKEHTKQALMKVECKNAFKYENADGKEVPVAAGECHTKAIGLIKDIQAAYDLKDGVQKQLDDLDKSENPDQNKVDKVRGQLEEAAKECRNQIAAANRFIAAAKKAAGGKGDKQNEGSADNAQAAGNQQAEQK